MKVRSVKLKMITAANAAALETAVNTYTQGAGEAEWVAGKVVDDAVGLTAYIWYSEG